MMEFLKGKIANHLDQSNYLAIQREQSIVTVWSVFIRLFQGSSGALKFVNFFQGPSSGLDLMMKLV
jgi:hypothetical protein